MYTYHFMIADCILLGVPQLEGAMVLASPRKLDILVGDGMSGVILDSFLRLLVPMNNWVIAKVHWHIMAFLS